MNERFSFKLLAWNFFYAILALLALPMILIIVVDIVWQAPSCQEDSEAVAYARSLSTERLARLYRDMELYSHREDILLDGYQFGDERYEVPKEFSDLKVRKIRPKDGNIMVEGCFDHYIYLTFKSVGRLAKPGEKKKIILNWGSILRI